LRRMSLKEQCKPTGEGYYTLEVASGVPVRIFLSEKLYAESEEALYTQIETAALFPGTQAVAITPDAHVGSTVPVGCVIATDGTLLQEPVGFDIGCGIMPSETFSPWMTAGSRRKRRWTRALGS
jgi:hypothetical protein